MKRTGMFRRQALAGLLASMGVILCALMPARAEDSLSANGNRFVFRDWAGPKIPVWYALPDGYDARTPIVFIMHGVKRDADRYHREWEALARRHGFILLVPEFSGAGFPGAPAYNLGNVFAEKGRRNPENIWSFSAIEPIFDHVKHRLNSDRAGYRIYGHSAGSQFVHRFLLYKPEARIERAIVANAGWYTIPDPDEGYPYGLKGSGVKAASLKPLLGKEVIVLLGNRDTDPAHKSLRRTPEALRQGKHRFSRGQHFFKKAQGLARELDAAFSWRVEVVDGAEHQNAQMAVAAAPILAKP